MSEPWYKDGLKFTCTRCGDCCTGEPGFVWIDDAELVALADCLGEPIEQVEGVYTRLGPRGRTLRERINGDCIFYDRGGRGCSIYPVRPRQCRTWPFWESGIETPAAWQQVCQICPGAGQGELIAAEEITRRVKVIRL